MCTAVSCGALMRARHRIPIKEAHLLQCDWNFPPSGAKLSSRRSQLPSSHTLLNSLHSARKRMLFLGGGQRRLGRVYRPLALPLHRFGDDLHEARLESHLAHLLLEAHLGADRKPIIVVVQQ